MKNAILFAFLVFVAGCATPDSVNIDLESAPDVVELFGPDFISTNLFERDLAISPDGQEMIYTFGDNKQTKRFLVRSIKIAKQWSAPEILEISGEYQDIEPFITPDGSKLYFASNRPIFHDSTRSDYNIWFATKENGDWSSPIALDSIINTKGNEFYPSLSRNGNLYFTGEKTDGRGLEDIFKSANEGGILQKPIVLDSTVNTEVYEFNAYISPDENLLIFSSFGRKDGLGGGDLYYSKKDEDGHWSLAVNMGEKVNSDRLDYCPFVDWEYKNLYFTSERMNTDSASIPSMSEFIKWGHQVENGFGNIYRIALSSLEF